MCRSFDLALNNDIALLLLDRPATRATITLPTAAAQLQQRAPVGSRLLSIGFGSEWLTINSFRACDDAWPASAHRGMDAACLTQALVVHHPPMLGPERGHPCCPRHSGP